MFNYFHSSKKLHSMNMNLISVPFELRKYTLSLGGFHLDLSFLFVQTKSV